MKAQAVRRARNVLVGLTLSGLVSAAYGATHYAANYGVDSPTCGASASPCRSITRTIANAAAGDTIMVRPGRYGADLNNNGIIGEPGEEVPALGGMIVIFKPLIVLSTDGAAATILDAMNVSANTNVLIVTGDAEFGRPEHGFTVTNTRTASGSGIAPQGTNLKIRGNFVIANGTSFLLGTGIDTEDLPYVILIEGNQVLGWNTGIAIRAAGETASKNQVSMSGAGIFASGGTAVGNVTVGNATGISLQSSASATGNAVYGNIQGFVVTGQFIGPFTGVIRKNNIFGSRIFGGAACGLVNNAVVGLSATNNYWGSSTGPGPEPADGVCNANGGTTTTTPFATTRFAINPSFEP